jgi:hypothetical protein
MMRYSMLEKSSLLGAVWLCLLNIEHVTATLSRMRYHLSVSRYSCLPGNFCLSRRLVGTNGSFLAMAYETLITH